MASMDVNGNVFFKDGWMLLDGGTILSAGVVDQPGLPSAQWLNAVRSHLLSEKVKLAIEDVTLETGAPSADIRVQFAIKFDTQRTERKDSYELFQLTAAAVKPGSGLGGYDWAQAFKIIDDAVTILRG